MSKFSSYPEQQLIFENWRSHNQSKTDIDALLEGITPEQDQLIQEKLDEVLGYGSIEDSTFLEVLSAVLGIIGLIPGIGIAADLLSALLNHLRGRKFDAFLDILAAVPAIGYAAFTVKRIRDARGMKSAAKYLLAFLKKELGDNWLTAIKRFLTKSKGETVDVVGKVAKRYFSDNTDEAAKVIKKFSDELGKLELAVLAFLQGPLFVTDIATGGALSGDGGSDKPKSEGKLVYRSEIATIKKYGDFFILTTKDGDKKFTEDEMKMFKPMMPQENWLSDI